ncbi:Fic family protein [Cetobacterium somerae]|uniref:Fic family protein n=1 Tax=Cetobacterium somerae TaxID=188913 RepID=UPI00211DC289|nr:Fic family protein [Cetobacterium somerae]
MPIRKKMSNEYLGDLLVRMAHHSTAIEGNTLTQADTLSILIYNYIPRDMSEREYHEVKNYKKTVDYLLKNEEKMSPQLIKTYHKEIMQNLADDNGEYKKISNIILGASFETSKPYQVPTLIQEWCDNYNFRMENAKTIEEKIEIIVDQHIKFEKIHPFSDGNGRTGRMLMIDSCIKENIPPIIIPKEEKGKYINYLSNENIKEFTKWGVSLSEKEAERIEMFSNKEKVQLILEKNSK